MLVSVAAVTASANAKDRYLRQYSEVAEFALPLAAGAGSLLAGDTKGLIELAESGGLTALAVEGLKHTVHEERPNGSGDDAFPSGHTALAFAGAAYVHYRYGWEYGLPMELAAAAVAYSRVEIGEHRWHDVLASAVIAHASAFLFVEPFDDTVTLLPFIGGQKGSFGFQARLKF